MITFIKTFKEYLKQASLLPDDAQRKEEEVVAETVEPQERENWSRVLAGGTEKSNSSSHQVELLQPDALRSSTEACAKVGLRRVHTVHCALYII